MVADGVEDLDYLAYSIVFLCAGWDVICVVLLDVDIMGKHVFGSKYPVPRQSVCWKFIHVRLS